jgi:hypothetical protein
MMKRSIALILMGITLSGLAFAGPQALLSGLKGKVEVKPVRGDWAPATDGMKIDILSTISTGFDATATVTIEKTKIVVKPLTRLTLDKLIEQSAGSVAASMFLRVGAVQASVKATTPGTPQDFKVQSPYSTASVRGTEFEYDGFALRVTEGIVRLIPGRPVRDIQPVEVVAPVAQSLSSGEGQGGEAAATGAAPVTGSDQGLTEATQEGGEAAPQESTVETTPQDGTAEAPAQEETSLPEVTAQEPAQAEATPSFVPDSGFDGAAPIEAANLAVAVNVAKNQQAVLQIATRLDTGTSAPPIAQASSSSALGTSTTTASTSGNTTTQTTVVKTGGVTITITEKK